MARIYTSATHEGTITTDVLLITVTDVETNTVLRAAQRLGREFKRRHIGNHTYFDLGEISGARVFLVRSEMGAVGPGASLPTVRDGIQALHPSAVIMLGIAFGVDPQHQKIGDVLVSKQILLYEPQRVGLGPLGEPIVVPRGARTDASPRLLDRFRSGSVGLQDLKVRFGLMFSGEMLVDHPDIRNQLRRIEPEAIGGEMEGAGLYVAAFEEKVDWIVVKAISDWADGTKATDKDANQGLAAGNATKFVFHVLGQGGFARSQAIADQTITQTTFFPRNYLFFIVIALVIAVYLVSPGILRFLPLLSPTTAPTVAGATTVSGATAVAGATSIPPTPTSGLVQVTPTPGPLDGNWVAQDDGIKISFSLKNERLNQLSVAYIYTGSACPGYEGVEIKPNGARDQIPIKDNQFSISLDAAYTPQGGVTDRENTITVTGIFDPSGASVSGSLDFDPGPSPSLGIPCLEKRSIQWTAHKTP
jgi:nucleoside phosphorylase